MKKSFMILGLITTLSVGMTLGGVFATYKNTTPSNNPPSSPTSRAELENNYSDYNNSNNNNNNNNNNHNSSNNSNSMGENPPSYIYKDGKLQKYDESEANKEGSITIASDNFKEGDSVDIRVQE